MMAVAFIYDCSSHFVHLCVFIASCYTGKESLLALLARYFLALLIQALVGRTVYGALFKMGQRYAAFDGVQVQPQSPVKKVALNFLHLPS